MTNEKDRLEAKNLALLYLNGYGVERVADEIARIRAEAVKAERERCAKELDARADEYEKTSGKFAATMYRFAAQQLRESPGYSAILSDDQEVADECLRTKQELGAGCHDQYGFDQEEGHGR